MFSTDENDAYVGGGMTYGEWKGVTGPGVLLKAVASSGRQLLTLKARDDIFKAHHDWCDRNPDVTREERAAAYKETHDRLAVYQ